MPECWKAIEGWPYEVSDEGRVRRTHAGQGARAGFILQPQITPNGYAAVHLTRGGKQRRFYVHRLVAAAFLGPIPPRHDVDHIDANKAHNNPRNLAIVTKPENHRRATAMGLKSRGTDRWNAKLDPQTVREIRQRAQAGQSTRSLALLFDVQPATIRSVVRRDRWAHVS